MQRISLLGYIVNPRVLAKYAHPINTGWVKAAQATAGAALMSAVRAVRRPPPSMIRSRLRPGQIPMTPAQLARYRAARAAKAARVEAPRVVGSTEATSAVVTPPPVPAPAARVPSSFSQPAVRAAEAVAQPQLRSTRLAFKPEFGGPHVPGGGARNPNVPLTEQELRELGYYRWPVGRSAGREIYDPGVTVPQALAEGQSLVRQTVAGRVAPEILNALPVPKGGRFGYRLTPGQTQYLAVPGQPLQTRTVTAALRRKIAGIRLRSRLYGLAPSSKSRLLKEAANPRVIAAIRERIFRPSKSLLQWILGGRAATPITPSHPSPPFGPPSGQVARARAISRPPVAAPQYAASHIGMAPTQLKIPASNQAWQGVGQEFQRIQDSFRAKPQVLIRGVHAPSMENQLKALGQSTVWIEPTPPRTTLSWIAPGATIPPQ